MNVQPSCCLDVVVYMLNCVFWRHILLEIEFKSRVDMGSDSNRYTAQRRGVYYSVDTSSCRTKWIRPPPPGSLKNEACVVCIKNLHYVVGNLGGTKIPTRCPLSKVAILTVPNRNKVPHCTKSKFELSNALTEMFLAHRHDLLYSCSAYRSAHLGILLCCNEYTFLLYCVP